MKKLLVIMLLSLAMPLCAMKENDVSRDYGLEGLSAATALVEDVDGSHQAAEVVLKSPEVKKLEQWNNQHGDVEARESAEGLVLDGASGSDSEESAAPAAVGVPVAASGDGEDHVDAFDEEARSDSDDEDDTGATGGEKEQPVDCRPSGAEIAAATSGDEGHDEASSAASSASSSVTQAAQAAAAPQFFANDSKRTEIFCRADTECQAFLSTDEACAAAQKGLEGLYANTVTTEVDVANFVLSMKKQAQEQGVYREPVVSVAAAAASSAANGRQGLPASEDSRYKPSEVLGMNSPSAQDASGDASSGFQKGHRRTFSFLPGLRKTILAGGGVGALFLGTRVSVHRVHRARKLGDQRSWWRVLCSRIQRSEKQAA